MRCRLQCGLLAVVLLGGSMIGCMHLKGVVVEDLPGGAQRPMRSAVLSIGRPDGYAVYGMHHVNDKGEFDFFIGPTDYNEIFVFDGSAKADLTMRRLNQTELGGNMTVRLRRASVGTPAMPADVNFNPL